MWVSNKESSPYDSAQLPSLCASPHHTFPKIMAPRPRWSEEYELLLRTSSDSTHASDTDLGYYTSHSKKPQVLRLITWPWSQLRLAPSRPGRTKTSLPSRKRRSYHRLLCCTFVAIACLPVVLIIFTALFRPLYTHLPAHYKALQRRCSEASKPGRGNINDEKVFIAAALYDPGGSLVGGDWGNTVLGSGGSFRAGQRLSEHL